MKKLKLIVIVLLAVMLFPFGASAKENEPIKVHIFKGDGCQYCAAALSFFESIEDEYGSYFDLVEHEVWSNQDNAALMNDVAAYFNDNVEGIPYIIIGEKTFQGYAESYNEDIKAAIKENYDSGNFEDIVEQIANGTLKADTKEKNNNTTTIIIIAVALIGFVALFYFARDEEAEKEVIEETKKEEVVSPKKEEVKKTTTKDTTKKTTTKKVASSKTTTTKKTTTAKKPSTAKKTNSTAKTTAKKTTKK